MKFYYTSSKKEKNRNCVCATVCVLYYNVYKSCVLIGQEILLKIFLLKNRIFLSIYFLFYKKQLLGIRGKYFEQSQLLPYIKALNQSE